MTEQQKVEEIIALMTFLQNYIQNNVKQSFTNLTGDLETLIKDYLNIFEKDGEYINVNQIRHNYPAIDLVNKKRDIAVQVTTNADLRKIKKTIATYKAHKLSYSELIIIGFVKASKRPKLPINVKLYSIDYLIELVVHGTSSQKDKAQNILKIRIPWNSLTPLGDELCFDVVFDVINRSAVRDYTVAEGDYNNMIKGLTEIKEIIFNGETKNNSIRAKKLSEYSANTKRQLSDIEGDVSEIIRICNKNKNQHQSDFVLLSFEEGKAIDELKKEIILKTNKLAEEFGLNKKIIVSPRY